MMVKVEGYASIRNSLAPGEKGCLTLDFCGDEISTYT
jgi:hypothetical protein